MKGKEILVLFIFLILIYGCNEDVTNNNQDTTEGKSIDSSMVFVQSNGATYRGDISESNIYVDTVEVTQFLYDSIMNTYTNYTSPTIWKEIREGDNYPAFGIGFFDALLFCNARSKIDGFDTVYTYSSIQGDFTSPCSLLNFAFDNSKNGYRLPNGAEQVFFASSDTTRDFFWTTATKDEYPKTANDTVEINEYCIWAVNANGSPNEVASKKANYLGLYDIAGNVAEWGLSPLSYDLNPQYGIYHPIFGGSFLSTNSVYLRIIPANTDDLTNTLEDGVSPSAGRGLRTVRNID